MLFILEWTGLLSSMSKQCGIMPNMLKRRWPASILGLHRFQWAQTHPDILKDVPASTMQGFLLQTALIDEARGVLKGTTQVMKTMHGALAHETVVAETASKS